MRVDYRINDRIYCIGGSVYGVHTSMMKVVRDIMTSNVVWISPAQQVKTAAILMKGHGISAIPVVYSHDSVVGIVYSSTILDKSPDLLIVDVMEKDFSVVSPDMPVYQASEMMGVGGRSHLLVVEDGRLVGIVSRGDIIGELGRSYDTLTGLPWQDALREWCISALDSGREISVILFDLDLFGRFNKRYGHVVGDKVLKAVADAIKTQIDPEKDILCRYAGDEFAVGSLRPAAQAHELAERAMKLISEISIDGLPERVSATFGIAGGRRAGGRAPIHSAATLDDLITNASLNCTASKQHRQEAVSETQSTVAKPAASARLKIQTIRLSTTDKETTVEVVLSRGQEEFSHLVTGFVSGGRQMLKLVAEAAAGAITKSLPPEHGVVVEDVVSFETEDGREVVSAVAALITPRGGTTHAGSAIVRRSDPYRAAVAAVLAATNRVAAIIQSVSS